MGWTDLFKSKKSAETKPDPSLRWFGKLPTYADYYTSPTDAEWAKEFNDWILKGYEVFHSRALSRSAQEDGVGRPGSERLPLAGCILRMPKSGMTVFASVQDYGGDMRGRHFPICFYVGYPTALWYESGSDRMEPALRVVDELMALRENVLAHFRSPGRFESNFTGREIELGRLTEQDKDEPWRRHARAMDVEAWFEAVRPVIRIDSCADWFARVASWGETLRSHDSESFEATLRFPISTTLSLDAQVTGWIRWLERRMNLKSHVVSMILTTTGRSETGSLTIIAREPIVDDFLLLTPMASTLSYVDDLAELQPKGDSQAGSDGMPRHWEDFVDS